MVYFSDQISISIIILILLYLLLHIFLFKGLRKSLRLPIKSSSEYPFISVIVAAKNEERIIGKCIESLKQIKYPENKFEIILVNDRSTDNTRKIMTDNSANNSFIKVIDSDLNSSIKSKANAINTGIKFSKGSIIIQTDADCTVNDKWILTTQRYFDDTTGLVCGFTQINPDNSLFAKVQSLDWLYLQTLACSSAGIGMPMSCIGNNLSIKKSVYEEIGGYSNIKFSVTEDLALLKTIKKQNKYKIKYPVNPDCLVLTNECNSIKELFSQKKRWFRGGAGINSLGYITGILLYLTNTVLLTGWIYLHPLAYLLFFILKSYSELILILPVYKRLEIKKLLKYYPLFSIYFALYGIILPITFLTGKKINWKGDKH